MDVNNIDYCDTNAIDEAAAKFVEVFQPIKRNKQLHSSSQEVQMGSTVLRVEPVSLSYRLLSLLYSVLLTLEAVLALNPDGNGSDIRSRHRAR